MTRTTRRGSSREASDGTVATDAIDTACGTGCEQVTRMRCAIDGVPGATTRDGDWTRQEASTFAVTRIAALRDAASAEHANATAQESAAMHPVLTLAMANLPAVVRSAA